MTLQPSISPPATGEQASHRPIWQQSATLDALNALAQGTLVAQLGICFVRISDNELEATMPVDTRTCQPFGLLHGGASVVLAETLGSVAGGLCVPPGQQVVGMEINASHLRAVTSGLVRGVCRPLRLGRGQQVWQIDIFDDKGRMNCTSRLTTAVVAAKLP